MGIGIGGHRLGDHPARAEVAGEIHARPSAAVSAPVEVRHLALLSGEVGRAGDDLLAGLLEAVGAPAPPSGASHWATRLGDTGIELRWERHTEFSTFTFFGAPAAGPPFATAALAGLPRRWIDSLPTTLLVAAHLIVLPRASPEPDAAMLHAVFGTDALSGSIVSGGSALAWSDFRVREDGFLRILAQDRALTPRQTGRLVQRLLEIETYRCMALLAFPEARRLSPLVTEAGDRLARLSAALVDAEDLEGQRRMLEALVRLAADLERLAAGTLYRFGAARAYHALVDRRIAELREERIEGLQPVADFMDRRLGPAMRTCEAVARRLEELATRIGRAGDLLRTQVDVALERQNRDLLASMNRRARLQLRLQETVEGLSVVAISYYAVGLVAYGLKAGAAAGLPISVELGTGAAVPLVAALVWLALRRLRRRLTRNEPEGP